MALQSLYSIEYSHITIMQDQDKSLIISNSIAILALKLVLAFFLTLIDKENLDYP